jgi:hypothetical protein
MNSRRDAVVCGKDEEEGPMMPGMEEDEKECLLRMKPGLLVLSVAGRVALRRFSSGQTFYVI